MHGMGRVPDEVGHLILSEDGAVIAVCQMHSIWLFYIYYFEKYYTVL